MFFKAHIKSSFVLGRTFSHEYIELLSVKLQISDFSTKNKISLINILNKNGPNIKLCCILRQISGHFLFVEPTLVLCFFKIS